MALVEVGDGGGVTIAVLKMMEEHGELCPLHAEVAPVEVIADGRERIGYVVELARELGSLVLKLAVAKHLRNGGGVAELAGCLDEGMETSVPAAEQGKEPGSCCLGNGVLSIVRPEEKLCNVGGFPRLPPSQ
jgi:hypothetical protein